MRLVGRRGFILRLGAAAVALQSLDGCDDSVGPAAGPDVFGGLDSAAHGAATDGTTPTDTAAADAAESNGQAQQDTGGSVSDSAVADAGPAPHDGVTSSDTLPVTYYQDGSPAEIAPITPNEEFYVVLWKGEPGEVDISTWELELRNQGTRVVGIDWDLLQQMPGTEREHTLQCIESKPGIERMNNAIWTGLPLQQLLDILGYDPDGASYLKYSGADGYTTSTPIGDLDKPIWLVWLMNGEPLPPEHGHPARLLIPGRFGWKNLKQLVWIDFVDNVDELSFQDNWATEYEVQSLTVSPTHMALVDDGLTVRILGRAYAGSDPITSVRVSFDDGDTWQEAEFTYAPGADVWTLWRLDWAPPETGVYRIATSCTTASGKQTDPLMQDDPFAIPWPGGQTVEIEVV